MKITDIEVFHCHCYRTNWVFCRVLTDSGVYGVGEGTLEYRELAVEQAILEFKRTIIGTDPDDIEKFRHTGYRDTYFRGGPVLMTALSAIEMALWDIKGKVLNAPVWQLLGGKIRDRIPCYANGWFAPAKTADEFAAKAKEAAAAGFKGLKWDPFGSAWLTLSKAELRNSLEIVQAVVDAVGADMEILIEGHGRFNVPTAIRIAHALEDFDILWFEEPLPPENLAGLAEVKRRVRVPIAAGERLYNLYQYRDFFQLGCADFIQPDISHAGGIMEMRTIAALAEVHHIPFCPHNPSGPVANAATLQLAACVPNFLFLETMSSDVSWRQEIASENAKFIDGYLTIPTTPGLGVDINLEEIAKHPYIAKDLRHYRGDLTDIRPPDAKSWGK